MRAGRLRHLVTVQALQNIKQPNGSMAKTWVDFTKLWADIDTLKSSEKAAVAASWPLASAKITTRYAVGILPNMRIVYGDVIYSILGVDDVNQRHRELGIICETGAKSQ